MRVQTLVLRIDGDLDAELTVEYGDQITSTRHAQLRSLHVPRRPRRHRSVTVPAAARAIIDSQELALHGTKTLTSGARAETISLCR